MKRLEPSLGRDLGYLRRQGSKKGYIGHRLTQMNTDLYVIIKKNISVNMWLYNSNKFLNESIMGKKLTKEELLAKANEPKMFAMKYHPFYRGKIGVEIKTPVRSYEDFAIWYTPGVAEPCLDIQKIKIRFMNTQIKEILLRLLAMEQESLVWGI